MDDRISATFLDSYDIDSGQGSWSPDGRWLLFSGTSIYEALEGENHYDLWLLDTQSGALRRLTLDTSIELDPQWSPDGTEVVYQKRGQGVWALNLATGSARQAWPHDADFLVVP